MYFLFSDNMLKFGVNYFQVFVLLFYICIPCFSLSERRELVNVQVQRIISQHVYYVEHGVYYFYFIFLLYFILTGRPANISLVLKSYR